MLDLTTAKIELLPCRKKPLTVQAAQIHQPFSVEAADGTHHGRAEDYLMVGVNGERYICEKEVFEKTYDWV